MKLSATNQKISWFYREDKNGSLDLSPAFQRKPVWNDEQASYLVDTVLNGLPFPEVYIRSTSHADGTTLHEIVDGQQRIRSLLQFAKNDLRLIGDEMSPKWIDRTIEQLPDSHKMAFWNYDVVVRDLGNATDGEIRDLFQRLNINQVVLTDQELRHARFKGDFIKMMEDLADDEWWVETHVVNVRQVRRMEDVEFVSELFIGLMAGPQDKKATIDQYYEEFENQFPDGAKARQHFEATRELINDVLGGPDGVRAWSGKSDFYSLFLAFGSYAPAAWSAKKKVELAETLAEFKGNIDHAKKKDNAKKHKKPVQDYVEAVTRAASDVGRRRARVEIIEALIDETV